MHKDFNSKILLAKTPRQQFKVLYDLARYIEVNQHPIESLHFEKLIKYHNYLKDVDEEKIQKLNKEFNKIKSLDYQFQIYLMNLERFLGQSQKEYEFLVKTGDQESAQQTFPIICLLDSVRSAHNIGSMFRNAECFGAQEVILCGLSPTPESPQVKKTAMGSDEKMKWTYAKDAIEIAQKLKDQGHTIWAVETAKESLDLNKITEVPSPLVLIFGHEQHGISLELLQLCDQIIEIPLYGAKNSLNVGVSQALVLNQIAQQL